MFKETLSQKERNQLLALVTDQQRDFLMNQLKRGRETIFARFMMSEKVHAIIAADDIELKDDEQNVVDWKIINYIDHGFGNRHGKCACGRSLRYEFTVQHTKSQKTITYGKDHLAQFLNLNVRDIDSVLNNIREIDYELDEILLKIKSKDYGYEILEELEGKVEIPKDIQEHVDRNIPLMNKHIRRLERLIHEIEREEANKRIEEQVIERNKRSKEQFVERNKEIETDWKVRERRIEEYQIARKLIEKRFEQEFYETQKKDFAIISAVNEQLPPNSNLGEIAFAFVKNGVTSATKVSHLIREHYNVNKEISIGIYNRPIIYMDVLKALMHYAEQGELVLDEESSSVEDCVFYVNLEPQNQQTTTPDEVQGTLF